MASTANAETTTDEAQKWREISLMTMQHARAHLIEQQQRLIEQIHGFSDAGASLCRVAVQSPEVEPVKMAVKPPSGVKMAVQPPPGLASQPGPTAYSKQNAGANAKFSVPARGLRPPPGLASAGTAPVAPPPGFSTQQGQKPKKQGAGYPQNPKTRQPSFFESRFGSEASTPAAPAVMNFDAYESD